MHFLPVVLALCVLAILITFFIFLRRHSVYRGATARDDQLWSELATIRQTVEAGGRVSVDDVAPFAARPELRHMLYSMLKYFEQLDAFPEEFLSLEQQARADLAYWLCHPNELGAPPDQIETVHNVIKQVDGNEWTYFALKFIKHPPHWSADGCWRLGVAGPYDRRLPPYSGAEAFSRFHRIDETTPEAEIDWYFATLGGSQS